MKQHRNTAAFFGLILLLFAAGSGLFAADHEVVYLEGFPTLRNSQGDEADIYAGDELQTGDTVSTNADDFVELEAEGYTIKVQESTVFTLLEQEEGGTKKDVVSCVLGKMSFSKNKFLGTEPKLMTNSAICGVRGTEIILYAGVDGTSLILVEEGTAQVEAEGKTVTLAKGEGVEVETGSAPGEKFAALAGEIDFTSWNEERIDKLLEDPVDAAQRVQKRLHYYAEEIGNIFPRYLEVKDDITRVKAELDKVTKEKGKEAAKVYGKKNLTPLQLEATYLYLNVRYYALSALSLRRFVSGRMYAILKARYITRPDDGVYNDYLDIHRRILEFFEREVVESFLVEADI